MDTYFNSPLLGNLINARLSFDSPLSSLALDLDGLSCRLADTPKRKLTHAAAPSLPAKRSRDMNSLTPSDDAPKSLAWDSDSEDSCDSGFGSFGSTTSSLSVDLDYDVSNENDIMKPAAPTGFTNLLRTPLRELSCNITGNRSPLKLARRSRLQTTSEKRAVANFKDLSPSNKKLKEDTDTTDQNSIKAALSRGDDCSDLIADFSAPYTLPRCISKHSDLQGVSPETVLNLLRGDHSADVGKLVIVDCRYPYEYQGGHIEGAENIYTKTAIHDRFMKSNEVFSDENKKIIIIFHCEFSSERGPRMCRYLRESDRNEHAHQYPKLSYPEMYILEGGYKAFYEYESTQCTPQSYKPMLHTDHSQDLKMFRAKTNSLNGSKANRRRLLRC